VNCGDGLLALTLRPLLENTDRLGLGRALRILSIYAAMATESFEGQTQELCWIEEGTWALADTDYEAMVLRKTCGYSFVAPALVGAAVARAAPAVEDRLVRFLRPLGLAFQIQDDLLNLDADRGGYGMELAGDLWEGKRTLILLHALRSAGDPERARALHILSKARPASDDPGAGIEAALGEAVVAGILDDATRRTLSGFLDRRRGPPAVKTEEEVRFLQQLIEAQGSVRHARSVAARHGEAAAAGWRHLEEALPDSVHKSFLCWLKDYVVQRDR
jgi:geranylgeranyl diphosphate synthase type II